jgi:hypothetical protein
VGRWTFRDPAGVVVTDSFLTVPGTVKSGPRFPVGYTVSGARHC